LLNKHAAAEPKLDAISESVIELTNLRDGSTLSWFDHLLQFLSSRRVGWFALGAAWLVIIALNMAARETAPAPVVAKAQSPRAVELLREQRALYAEMIGGGMTADAAPPRPKSHKQSAREVDFAFA
jgi:hypothetical protein